MPLMKKKLLPVVVCALLLPYILLAQEYSYTHYNLADGLAGSTVYCITQDKDGFLWTGTEAGVSRFDGTHFKNFTTKDGLPDLEILQIFSDSKGRVWMAPFCKSLCFYYQGKIHNAQNDSLLSQVHLKGNIEGFAEDIDGNVLLQEQTALHLLGADGSVTEYNSVGHMRIVKCNTVSRSRAGHFLVEVNKKIVEFAGKKCIQSIPIVFEEPKPTHISMCSGGVIWKESSTRYAIMPFSTKKIVYRSSGKIRSDQISFSMLDDSLGYSNEISGSFEYNINTGQTKTYLQGVAVSRVFRDVTGNLWFTTLGEGIFRLNSNEVKTIRLSVEPSGSSSVTAIRRIGKELWVGDNHNYIFRLSLPQLTLIDRKPFFQYGPRRILYIDTVKDRILSAGDEGMHFGTWDYEYSPDFFGGGVKSVVRMSAKKMLVANSQGAYILDLDGSAFRDTIWQERTTIAFYKDDTIYIGSLNGLYRSVKGQPFVFLGEKTPFLRKRICSIDESSDGTLWIASNDDAGIIGYKSDRQVALITRRQGLTSDICRTVLVHGNVLWAGTDKGLNRIELNKPGYHITQYTSKDGLASNMVNTVLADGSRVYVGTSEGLSFFDEKSMVTSEDCRLYLLSLINSERDRIADTAHLVIPYNNKRIRFEFAAISYRSAGDITYRYRMLGLDSTWRETRETVLEYPDLPSGDYEWQLMAVNKFGTESRLLHVPVKVGIQFWKKPGVIIAAWLLSLALLWLLIFRRIARIRRRQQEKELLAQRISELESTALKSQMNPHFIFNCLSSVQQFIISGNTVESNKYISGLARLIRTTLHNSSKSFVSLKDEVDYLSSYLSLEKMRFKEKIDYNLVVDPSIDPLNVLIPPMLIQPYVENALQHGLRNKTAGKGLITIKMNKEPGMLVVTVEDNGVGRSATTANKSAHATSHHSKGMTLTQDRIALMNKLYEGTPV